MKMEILNLGKMLVNELGLDDSVDTLSRWMAHYITQQMADIESSEGERKTIAERKCFETILKLWKHRAYHESVKYPFERFEPIFKTLERLDPENEHNFFSVQHNRQQPQDESEEQVTINNLVNMVIGIDKTARIWINYILKQATICAADEKTIEWLRASAVVEYDNLDTGVIIKLLEPDVEEDKDVNKTKIQERIEQLERFRDFNEDIIRMYSEELANIKFMK